MAYEVPEQAATRVAPAVWRWTVLVAISLAMFGNYYAYDAVAPVADLLASRYPDREDGTYFQATALLLRGRAADAATLARRAVAASMMSAKAQNLLGATSASRLYKESTVKSCPYKGVQYK